MPEQKAKGKIKEVLGWATGDRRVEAEGRVEKRAGDADDDGQMEKAERQVRREEGDIVTDEGRR